MKVMMLDTMKEVELPHHEACAAIDARVAVEVVLGNERTNPPAPESAMLDRAGQTMTKPRPQPRSAPREKRRKKH